jgi:hypothetical protein
MARWGEPRDMTGLLGDFSVVLAVKKENKRAPQALADGRKGTGNGWGGLDGSLALLTTLGHARGAEYEFIYEDHQFITLP